MNAGRRALAAIAVFLIGWGMGGAVKRLGASSQEPQTMSGAEHPASVLPHSRAGGSQTLTGAVRRLQSISNHYRRSREMHRWAETVSPEDWEEAARLLSSGDLMNLRVAVDVWAAQDPARTLAVLQSIQEQDYRCLRAVFSRWVRVDPDEAWRTAGHSGYSYHRRVLAFAMLEIDPDRGVDWIGALPKERYTTEECMPLHVSSSNVERLKRAAASLPREGCRKGIVSQVARFLSRTDPEGAMQWALEMGPPGGLVDELLGKYHGADPEAAKLFVQQVGGGSLPVVLAKILAASDPEGAFEFSRGLGVDSRNAAMVVAVRAWAEENAAMAAQNAGLIGNRSQEKEVWAAIWANWFEQNPNEAMTRLEAYPYEEARWDWGSVYPHWLNADLDRMTEFMLGFPQGHHTELFAATAAGKFVADDRIDDGLAWYDRLDEAHQARAYRHFLKPLVRSGKIGEAERMARGAGGKTGMQAFAKVYFAADAEAAVQWAQDAGDADVLTQLRFTVQELPFPPERRTRLLTLLGE